MSTLRRRAETLPPEDPPGPALLTPLDERLGFWLRLAQQAGFETFHRRLAPLGLTPGRLGVLLLIEAQPAIRQAALAAALRVKPPNMAVLLAAMEQDGLIRRVVDAEDRRAWRLRLTPSGRALLKRGKAEEKLVEQDLAAGLDAPARAALIAALRRIAGG
jgi:DNA-binding MarR family transcriptional regulator